MWLLWVPYARADEEPFAWFQGLSIWPTELVRCLAGLFGIYFILKTRSRLLSVKYVLAAQFRLVRPNERECRLEPSGLFKNWRQAFQ